MRFASRRGPNAADDDIAALAADSVGAASGGHLGRRAGGARAAAAAPRWSGPGTFRARLDELGVADAATASPSSTGSPAPHAARASRRPGRRRALGDRVAAAGDRRPRARLRRHLPARHRAPERAHRAGGAGARRRARPQRRRGARRLRGRASRRWARSRARATRPSTTRGWHPTAVCGGVGAAVAAARLLGLDADAERSAVALALLRRGRAARRVRLGRQVAPGGAGGGGRACGRRGWPRPGRAVPLERGRARLRGGHRRRLRRARPGRARDRARTGSRPGPAACRRTARSRRPDACARRGAEPALTVIGPPGVAPGGGGRARAGRRPPGEVLDPLPDRLHAAARAARGRRASTAWTPRRSSARGASRSAPTARCSSPRPCCSTRRRGARPGGGGARLARAAAGRARRCARRWPTWPRSGSRARSTTPSARPRRAAGPLDRGTPPARSTIGLAGLADAQRREPQWPKRSRSQARDATAKIRNPLGVIGLTLITLGIYFFFWWYYINREMKRPRSGARRRPGGEARELGAGGHRSARSSSSRRSSPSGPRPGGSSAPRRPPASSGPPAGP